MAEVNRRVTVEVSSYSCEVSASNRRVGAVSKENHPPSKENLKGFRLLVGLAQVLGLLAVFLIIYWIYKYEGGLKFKSRISIKWHMFLLSIGFIYLNGNTILIYRMMRNRPKNTLKWIHANVGGSSCCIGALGVWAAYPKRGFLTYYTLHSWIGILTLVVYIAQTIIGLYAFLYSGIKSESRASLVPYHRIAGQILLVLSTIAVVSGINEKALYKLADSYEDQPAEAMVLNSAGVLFALFTVVVIFIASNIAYRRYPRSVDN